MNITIKEISKEDAKEVSRALATLQKFGVSIGEIENGPQAPTYTITIPRTGFIFERVIAQQLFRLHVIQEV